MEFEPITQSGGPYKLGQRFGAYVLEAYLGGGAFKTVYRAKRVASEVGHASPDTPSLLSPVALCFPHQQDAEGLRELEKEFSVVQRLNHPNITRAYELEHSEGVAFLVMEYVEGESLRARLKAKGCLPQDQALRIAGLVCEALAYAHSSRTLHRDVKPENVLLTQSDTPTLLDFGIARVLTYTLQKASTQIGTVDYMAPEGC